MAYLTQRRYNRNRRLRIIFAITLGLLCPSLASGQIVVGIGTGAIHGVPGLSSAKWGVIVGLNTETKGKRLRVTVEGDYVTVPNASSCCGPPGGFTYDDRAVLEMLGLKYFFGSERLQFVVAAQGGAEQYREFRRGSVPGFNPAPTTWHSLAIVEAGVGLSAKLSRVTRLRVELRQYTSGANPLIGEGDNHPAVMLFFQWH